MYGLGSHSGIIKIFQQYKFLKQPESECFRRQSELNEDASTINQTGVLSADKFRGIPQATRQV